MPRDIEGLKQIKPEHLNKFWVTFPGHYSVFGKVHNSDCRYFDRGYGRLLTAPEIIEYAPASENCKICGGWGGV